MRCTPVRCRRASQARGPYRLAEGTPLVNLGELDAKKRNMGKLDMTRAASLGGEMWTRRVSDYRVVMLRLSIKQIMACKGVSINTRVTLGEVAS